MCAYVGGMHRVDKNKLDKQKGNSNDIKVKQQHKKNDAHRSFQLKLAIIVHGVRQHKLKKK